MMKTLLILLTIFSSHALADEWTGLVRESSCLTPTPTELTATREDFPWTISLEEAKNRANALYDAGKRLKDRAYLNSEGELVLPYRYSSGEPPIKLEAHFIKSIRRHLEEALRLGYADVISFADMGHNHLYIPLDFYNDVIQKIPASNSNLRFEKMFGNPEIKFLYHTAEQLNFFDERGALLNDRHIQWRFYTRNLIGDNKGEGRFEFIFNHSSSHNTANRYMPELYKYWGAGIYITSSKESCFPYQVNGETRYFDINIGGF